MAENCTHDCATCGQDCAEREVPAGCTHDCSTCGENCPSRNGGSIRDLIEPAHEMSEVGKVIAVASGKGGVGKSMVTSLLAVAMSRLGYRVGILDSDVTGPSIPRAFGIKERAQSDAAGIYPAETANGVSVKYANIFLHDVQNGDVVVDEGKTLRDYITEYMTRAKNDQIHRFATSIGVDEAMLRSFMQLKVTDANINEFGRFDKLKATVDKATAKAFLEALEGAVIKPFQVNMKVDQILRKFILEGEFDIV